jgi:butyryl-CoA dehydrogenase
VAATVARARESGLPEQLKEYSDQLEQGWQQVGKVTALLYACGDMNKTLANASVYLEAVGHTIVAWIWLEQALVAARRLDTAPESEQDFYRGKLQACRYFYHWELPKAQPQLDLLAKIDTTTLDMQDAWF